MKEKESGSIMLWIAFVCVSLLLILSLLHISGLISELELSIINKAKNVPVIGVIFNLFPQPQELSKIQIINAKDLHRKLIKSENDIRELKNNISKLTAEIRKKNSQINLLKHQLGITASESIQEATTKTTTTANYREIAKIIQNVSADAAVDIMMNLDDNEIINILSSLNEKKAAEIISAFEPTKAAKLMRMMTK